MKLAVGDVLDVTPVDVHTHCYLTGRAIVTAVEDGRAQLFFVAPSRTLWCDIHRNTARTVHGETVVMRRVRASLKEPTR